jgi:hypothetical protein
MTMAPYRPLFLSIVVQAMGKGPHTLCSAFPGLPFAPGGAQGNRNRYRTMGIHMPLDTTSESSAFDHFPTTGERHRAKKSTIRKIRYTPEEWAIVVANAANCHIPPATYVRITSLGFAPKVPRTGVNADVLRQLTRIGNNLNQLARIANISGKTPTEIRCRVILEHVLAAINRID